MTTASIISVIMEKVDHELQAQMQHYLPEDDISRAGLVRIGLLQDDPVGYVISILTLENDPDAENSWRHSVVGANEPSIPAATIPSYTLGGGQFQYRRFTTVLEQFMPLRTERYDAQRLASIVLSRAECTIRNMNIAYGPDSFGEIAMKAYVMHSINIVGGGDDQLIYHGKIWWQALTEMMPMRLAPAPPVP